MALMSPGVEITIVDESQYLPSAPASVPLILLATAENKANGEGTGVAAGTTSANANKLYRLTSQRDLTTLFGNPFFYKTTNGTPLQGYELNEYGLLSAFSVLGTTNLCYVLRADIDLATLVGRTGRPSGAVPNGTYWLDLGQLSSSWGIHEFNQTTGNFVLKSPIIINDSEDLVNGVNGTGQPLPSIGNAGDYAVTFKTDSASNRTEAASPRTYSTFWFKAPVAGAVPPRAEWVAVGSHDWMAMWPTVQGTVTNPSISAPVVSGSTNAVLGSSNAIVMTINDTPVVFNLGDGLNTIVQKINDANVPFVEAKAVNGRLHLFMSNNVGFDIPSDINIKQTTTSTTVNDYINDDRRSAEDENNYSVILNLSGITDPDEFPTATINGVTVIFDTPAGEDASDTAFANAAELPQIVNSINSAMIDANSPVRASISENGKGLLLINPEGSGITIVNGLADADGVFFAGTGSATGLVLSMQPMTSLSTDLGVNLGKGYNPVELFYGTHAQQPTKWRSVTHVLGSTEGRPTGSVWIKTSAVNNGANMVVRQYNSALETYNTILCPMATNDWILTNSLDSAGGKNIPAGSIYAQFNFNNDDFNVPLQFYRRAIAGESLFVATMAPDAMFTADSTVSVRVSIPGRATLSEPYSISVLAGDMIRDQVNPDGSPRDGFATKWQHAQIPHTEANVNPSTGLLELIHTEGGVIVLDDGGVADSPVSRLGFFVGNGPGSNSSLTKWGPYKTRTYTGVTHVSAPPLTGFTASLISNEAIVNLTSGTTGSLRQGMTLTKVSGTGAFATTASIISIDSATRFTLSEPHTISGPVTFSANVPGTGARFRMETTGPTITGLLVENGGSGYLAGSTGEVMLSTAIGDAGAQTNYEFKATVEAGVVVNVSWVKGLATPNYTVLLSPWVPMNFIPSSVAPSVYPTNNTPWYFSSINQFDIMVNNNGAWRGYRNVSFDDRGMPTDSTAQNPTGRTDFNGPILSANAPETQSLGTPLVYGDLWLDTNDLENFPSLSRWQNVDGIDQWVKIDNTDQTTENGIVFADARWGATGTEDPIFDALPSISGMLTSNYVDPDVVDPAGYPEGTLLFNTRRSSYNVKEFRTNYFNTADFPDMTLPQERSTWVTVSGNKPDGSPYMGRKAQRIMVVKALKATLDSNSQIREEDTFFNLLAAPGYPELQPNLVQLNNDRNQTAYIIGDTPMRLSDDANEIVAWATNAARATGTGEDGLVTRNTFMGLYYPSGITTDPTGSEVTVPSSHMILRTMIYNDTVAYPWFAPAGQRRGIIDNANNIGFINKETGEFNAIKNRAALRNVEYTNFINPISYFTNLGLLNFGNKNSFDSQSALDRTNVARLVCYLRHNLQIALRPFIFEPNDNITRSQARSVVQTLLADIQTKRGIYDYLVVCDESNNTPARIDRNELWVDVAIEPVKAAEFIYVPVRILNTGEISGGQ